MSMTPAAASSLDGNFLRFEVRDGIRRISCSVSDEALNAVSGLTAPSTPMERRKSFDRFRTLIHAAAMLRLRALSPGSVGSLVLTHRDLRCVPPESGTPLFGSSAKGSTRPAPPGGMPATPAIASSEAATFEPAA